jgi:hypothetical protein
LSLKVVPPGSKAPRAPRRTKDYAAEALALLEVAPEALAETPRITHLLRPIGGSRKVFEYLSGSEKTEARKILELRIRLNKRQQAAVPFEAYCVAAGVSTKTMFGIISEEVMEQSGKARELIVNASRQDVIQAAVESAKTMTGTKDREYLLKHDGFLPLPKSTTVFGNVDNRKQTANVVVLPPVEVGIKRISDRFNTDLSAPPVRVVEEVESEDENGDEED